ncbi:hypothetical protein ACI394_29905, partial [Klebsiella pneumoniae]|uniref:hypothetical protein n=1 Tax=Klebsiella pneumoniae TaxID=573 RepID=UPI0038534439
ETGRRFFDNQGNDMPDVLPDWADSDEDYLTEMDRQQAEMERLLPLYRAEKRMTEGYEPHELDSRWIQENLK